VGASVDEAEVQVAPVGRKTVCVDLDGVLLPWGPLLEDREPPRGAGNALQRLRDEGYWVVILTSRFSPTWWASDPSIVPGQQILYVYEWLDRHAIPYDLVTCEKVPALVYIDDRAVRFEGDQEMDPDEMSTIAKEILLGWYD